MAEWSSTTMATALSMVKTDLKISAANTAYDTRLTQYIETAKDEAVREGVNDLSDAVSDVQMVAALAAWMWTHRNSGDAMPIWLRKMLNNRIFSVHMQ